MWASVEFCWNSSPHSLCKTLSQKIQNPRRQITIILVFELIIQNKPLTSWIVQLGVILSSHDDSKQTMTIMIIRIISSHSEHVSLTFFAIVSGTLLSALICITRSQHPEFVKTARTSSSFAKYSILTKKELSYSINNIVYQILPHFHSLPDFHFPNSLKLCMTNTLYSLYQYIVHQATLVSVNKSESDHSKI